MRCLVVTLSLTLTHPLSPSSITHSHSYEAMALDLLGGTPAMPAGPSGATNVFVYEAETQGGERARPCVCVHPSSLPPDAAARAGWLPAGRRPASCCPDAPTCTHTHPAALPLPRGAGKVERKEHALNERDALYCDLRHKHFAAASLAISNLLDQFRAKNKARAGGGVQAVLGVWCAVAVQAVRSGGAAAGVRPAVRQRGSPRRRQAGPHRACFLSRHCLPPLRRASRAAAPASWSCAT